MLANYLISEIDKRVNRVALLRLLGAATLGITILASWAQAAPNILYIMSDDHTSQAIGAYGSRLAVLNPTPNIDRFAKEGIVLKNTFCTNSICTPSRATILTGQYSQTNGVLDLRGNLPVERQYLAHEMKKAGYETAMIGKWHLKEEPASFDYYQVLPGQGRYMDPELRTKGAGTWPNNIVEFQGHSSDVITDLSIQWLKQRDKSKPFFLMHHFKAPHGRWQNASRYDDYLENVSIPEPESLYSQPLFGSRATRGESDSLLGKIGSSVSRRNSNNILLRFKASLSSERLKNFAAMDDQEYTHEAYQLYLKHYLRCVKGVDDNFQRLIDYLKNENLLDNTVVIYTSDQGMMLGEHDYIDKRWMYEESLRMPFIVRYPPTITAESQSDAIVNNSDFAPTILDFAGVETPKYMQGRSFKSILQTGNEPEDWPHSTYYRYWMHMMHHANPAHFGIRTKDYKLIFYYGSDVHGQKKTPTDWELYDMRNDPHELCNLYNDPSYKEVIAGLKTELQQKREALHETDVRYPEIQRIIEQNWN